MAHKIFIKKITRDYKFKPTIFERYVLWSMGIADNWLFLFIIGLFMMAITLTLYAILGFIMIFEGI